MCGCIESSLGTPRRSRSGLFDWLDLDGNLLVSKSLKGPKL
jgi:hypothetical protein